MGFQLLTIFAAVHQKTIASARRHFEGDDPSVGLFGYFYRELDQLPIVVVEAVVVGL